MDMTNESCRDFVEALASSAATPGGGGAAALAGAIGAALGNMVGSLTIGKKKYADVQEEMAQLHERCSAIQTELLDQVKADEESFLPLVAAYRIPKDDPNRDKILEEASVQACAVPLRIMELCCQALECIDIFSRKGARAAVSDAGCGAILCKAALQAASLNVFINTKDLKDARIADTLNSRANAMLVGYGALADEIFSHVRAGFGR